MFDYILMILCSNILSLYEYGFHFKTKSNYLPDVGSIPTTTRFI